MLGCAREQERTIAGIFGEGCRYDGDWVHDHPLICLGFTNRSGSNLLASYLRGCPPLSGFHEDLNSDTIQAHAKRLGTNTLPETLRQLSISRRGEGGVYGVKASVEQLIMLKHFGIDRMYRDGLHVIELRRSDIVGQAISYQIALQTGRWTSWMQPGNAAQPVCDPPGLVRLIRDIRASQTLMDLVVEQHQIPRLILDYDALVTDPDAQLQKIANFCGFDPTGWSANAPALEQQADETNADFRSTFQRHLRTGLKM